MYEQFTQTLTDLGGLSMVGIVFTITSAVFLGLTVIFDKVMVPGDCYQNNPRAPWVVSSVFGAALGLIAVCLGWLVTGDVAQNRDATYLLMTKHTMLAGLLVLSGAAASLTLRSYFQCFVDGSLSTLIAMAIAITPMFVFLTTTFVDSTTVTALHWLSVLLAVVGLAGFQYVSNGGNWSLQGKVVSLGGVVVFGTVYVVLLSQSLAAASIETGLPKVSATLSALPFYWMGFAIGIVDLRHKSVRSILKNIWTTKKYFYIIVVMEILGMSFYFFEAIGLSELNASIVAVLIGAHIVMVWGFDLYLYKRLKKVRETTFTVMIFTLQTVNFIQYRERPQVWLQGLSIAILVIGISIWPR